MDKRVKVNEASILAREIFEKQGWTWHGDDKAPSLQEITTTINYLIDTLRDEQYERDQVSTGRLMVQPSPYDPDNPESFEILLTIGDYFNDED